MWVRDLTEEGIEPHPGPRFLSWNPNGLNDNFRRNRFFKKIFTESSFKPIAAVFIQEHNIKSNITARIHADAKRNGLFIFMSPISNYATKGGTAIIIPKTSSG